MHLIRNTFRLASKADRDALKRDVRPIYTAVNADAARAALDQLAATWGKKYGAVIRLWENAWNEFIPFLDYGACRRFAMVLEGSGCPALGHGLDAGFGVLGQGRVVSGVGSAVDLHEVEGGCGELEFSSGGVQSAA